METKYDLYGLQSEDLVDLSNVLGRILKVQFEYRSSSFVGEYFQSADSGGENFKLLHNYFEGEEEWMEPDFKDYLILFYVNRTRRAIEIEVLLTEALGDRIKLLRREGSGDF